MSKITEQDIALMDEIKTNPLALELLKAKCSWEHISTFKVLHEYGDPRQWESYKQESEE